MVRFVLILSVLAGLLSSCGIRRHKYENPIAKDTKQPDKVLFDKAINDIEHGRYEIARITLNTLINTYDQSEFMAKAKLAIADSWYREGGIHGLAQAEAEYKDFILFYPTMEEAAESQERICQIHYKQMDKSDRDPTQTLRAEDECRQLIVQFPNSKFVPDAQQMLRNIQEALADAEFRVGDFYHKRGANPAAANRLKGLVDQYPLYSRADEALWELADSYSRMGNRFRQQEGDAYARIVKEYPLSDLADSAKRRLKDLEFPVPEPDPDALARMKYDQEHPTKLGILARSTSILRSAPDVSHAAKTGTPAMTAMRPTVPASVPTSAGATGITDVTATTIADSTALDTKPDARQNPPVSADGKAPAVQTAQNVQNDPPPSNYQARPAKKKKTNKKAKPTPAEQAQPVSSAQPPTDSSAAQAPASK